MTRILVVNPNTSASFTAALRNIVAAYALPSTVATVLNPTSGPASIESVFDEVLSAPATLELVLRELDSTDGIIVACYSDHPVISAIREVTSKPVLGIAEASIYVACMLGKRFSIVTTNDAWQTLLGDAVRHYGLSDRCASVRATGLAVLALESATDGLSDVILTQARKAVADDGAEVICLGCAGMAGLDKWMERELGVPVLDGTVCALKLLEGLVGYGLFTSKRRTYAVPHHKDLHGLPDIFSRGYAAP